MFSTTAAHASIGSPVRLLARRYSSSSSPLHLTYDGLDMNYLLTGLAAPKFCLLEA